MNATPLEVAVQGCSLHALQMLVTKALTDAGYGDIQTMGRMRSTQKTRFGGFELRCVRYLNGRRFEVVVKVLRDHKARVRCLDELAGVVLRTKADQGIIVAPHGLTQTAQALLGEHRPLRVEAIDGAELTALMRKFGIGVRGQDEVDYAYFGSLELGSEHIIDFWEEHR